MKPTKNMDVSVSMVAKLFQNTQLGWSSLRNIYEYRGHEYYYCPGYHYWYISVLEKDHWLDVM